MTTRTTYKVRAKRWTRGWELHIDGVGVTQSRSLSEAEGMVRDYIALDHDVPPDCFDVDITTEVGNDLDAEIRRARALTQEAEQVRDRAAATSRAVAARLKAAGLSGRDIAAVLQISPQRVSQLLKS